MRKGKKSNVKVAWRRDDGTTEILTQSEFRDRVFRNPPQRYTDTDDLIAKFRNGGKVRGPELIRELAIAKLYHLDFGEGPDAAIRFELIDLLAAKLTTLPNWSRAQASVRNVNAARRYTQWKARAKELERDHPEWSQRRIAKTIANEQGIKSFDRIRLAVYHPKK